MTALTDSDVQTRIMRLVGDIDSTTLESVAPDTTGGVVKTAMAGLWQRHSDKYRTPGLRELYVARDGLDIIISLMATRVDVSLGISATKDSQEHEHRVSQRDRVQKEIERIERIAAATRAPATGMITADAPLDAPAGSPDANSPLYGGHPYYPLRDRR